MTVCCTNVSFRSDNSCNSWDIKSISREGGRIIAKFGFVNRNTIFMSENQINMKKSIMFRSQLAYLMRDINNLCCIGANNLKITLYHFNISNLKPKIWQTKFKTISKFEIGKWDCRSSMFKYAILFSLSTQINRYMHVKVKRYYVQYNINKLKFMQIFQ